jgi:hypothetical protein
MATVGYVYVLSIDDGISMINSIADDLLLSSEALQVYKESQLMGVIGAEQIEIIDLNIREYRRSLDEVSNQLHSLAGDLGALDVPTSASLEESVLGISSTLSSANNYLGHASQAISNIKELKVGEALPDEYVSAIDGYSEEFAYYGRTLKHFTSTLPLLFITIGVGYGMFMLMGASILILTRKIDLLKTAQ